MRSRIFTLLPLSCAFVLLQGVRGAAQTGDPQKFFEHAVQLHASGDIEGAIREYRAFLALRPTSVEGYSNLGAAYARLGQYEQAIEQYKLALALDSENTAIRFNLGLAYYKAAKFPLAASELAAVTSSQPQNKNAALLQGDCYLRMGEFKKVIELLSPLESSNSDDRALAYLLGLALIRDNQVERGQLLIDRILRNGESAEAHMMMGTAHLMAKQLPAAVKEFRQAIELNPKLPTLYSFYGRALLATGDRDSAFRAFQKELEANPNDFEANIYSGVVLREDQKFDQAQYYFQRALQVRPGEPNARYFLGAVSLARGDIAQARRILEELSGEVPDFVEAHVLLATVYYRLKRKEEGDRERATIARLNQERQARQPGAQEGLGPAYRGESVLPIITPRTEKRPPR